MKKAKPSYDARRKAKLHAERQKGNLMGPSRDRVERQLDKSRLLRKQREKKP